MKTILRCLAVVQLLSHVRLFMTLWTAACQVPCPSLSPEVCSNSCPVSQWYYPTISSSDAPLSSYPQSFPASGSFPVSSSYQVAKVLELQHQSFNEYLGLISFRIDWLDRPAVQGTLKSSPRPQFKSINFLALSFLHSPVLTSTPDYWKNHSFDYMDLCQQSNVFAF